MMYERTQETRDRILARDAEQRAPREPRLEEVRFVQRTKYGFDLICYYSDDSRVTFPTFTR